jgi:hypothetical protein
MLIYKFKMYPFEVVSYDLPEGSSPLSLLVYDETIWLYVAMGASTAWQRRTFACYPAGEGAALSQFISYTPKIFIGTVMFNESPRLVFHVYEVTSNRP